MRKLLFVILLLGIFNLVYSQSIRELKSKIDSLKSEVKLINSKIERLDNKKVDLEDQIENYNQKINKIKLGEEYSKGMLAKVKNSGGNLYDKPDWSGKKIEHIPGGDTVLVYNWYQSPNFKVKYKDKVGYISHVWLLKNKHMREMMNNNRTKTLIKEYGKQTAEKILRHRYWIGMTKSMARESLGSPEKINRTKGSWGVHEQWVYEDRNLYLYFENGKLASFQD